MRKRIQFKSLVYSIVMVLVFCGAVAFAASASDVSEVNIGLIMPLTGGGAQVGQDQRDGFLLGVDRINKNLARRLKVSTVVEDSQAKNDLAAQAAIKQIQINHVSLIVGAWTGPIITMAPICAKNEVVLLNNGAQGTQLSGLSPYLFNTIPSNRLNAVAMATFLRKEKGLKTAAIISEISAAGKDHIANFTAKFEELGGKIVGTELNSMEASDFRSFIMKLKNNNPDIIVNGNTLQALTRQLYVQAKELQYKSAFGTLWGNASGHYTRGMDNVHYSVVPKSVIDPDVAVLYKGKYNKEMEFYAAQNWNASMILEKVLVSLLDHGKKITGENIRTAILEIQTFPVMGGDRVFNKETNTASADMLVYDETGDKEVVAKLYKAADLK
jgi:branched-chain amino acid transport system substrate-binding protein